jgi:hypothetical protein
MKAKSVAGQARDGAMSWILGLGTGVPGPRAIVTYLNRKVEAPGSAIPQKNSRPPPIVRFRSRATNTSEHETPGSAHVSWPSRLAIATVPGIIWERSRERVGGREWRQGTSPPPRVRGPAFRELCRW